MPSSVATYPTLFFTLPCSALCPRIFRLLCVFFSGARPCQQTQHGRQRCSAPTISTSPSGKASSRIGKHFSMFVSDARRRCSTGSAGGNGAAGGSNCGAAGGSHCSAAGRQEDTTTAPHVETTLCCSAVEFSCSTSVDPSCYAAIVISCCTITPCAPARTP